MTMYIGTVLGNVNDIHDNTFNIDINVSPQTDSSVTTEDIPCEDINTPDNDVSDNPKIKSGETAPEASASTNETGAKPKQHRGRPQKKTQDQYQDPTCIFRQDDITGSIEISKKAFVEICNNSTTPTAAFYEMKTGPKRSLFYLCFDDKEEMAYYLDYNAKNTDLYLKLQKFFTPSVVKSVILRINREAKEQQESPQPKKPKFLDDEMLGGFH